MEVYENIMLSLLAGIEELDRDKLFCFLHDKHNRLVNGVQHALNQIYNQEHAGLYPSTTLNNVQLILEMAANEAQEA